MLNKDPLIRGLQVVNYYMVSLLKVLTLKINLQGKGISFNQLYKHIEIVLYSYNSLLIQSFFSPPKSHPHTTWHYWLLTMPAAGLFFLGSPPQLCPALFSLLPASPAFWVFFSFLCTKDHTIMGSLRLEKAVTTILSNCHPWPLWPPIYVPQCHIFGLCPGTSSLYLSL